MTGEEQELLEQYLTHLNILGQQGTHPPSSCWRTGHWSEEVSRRERGRRYANGAWMVVSWTR